MCCQTCIPHHLLQDRSSSPLSDIPPTSGSRSRRLSHSQIHRNYRRLRTHVGKAQLIMSPHFSRAKCSSTGYRGRKLRKGTKVMEFCRNLIEKGKRAVFLAAFRIKGYQVVPCPRCVYYFLHHLHFPMLKLGNLLGIDLSSFSTQNRKVVGMVIPPPNDVKLTNEVGSRIKAMEAMATKMASPERGNFKTITFGIQKGAGSQVSICLSNST